MSDLKYIKQSNKIEFSVNEIYHLRKILNNKFCTYYLRSKIKSQLLKKLG